MLLSKRIFKIIVNKSESCMLQGKIFCRAYPAARKRFYKNVTVSEFNGEFEINLDKSKLKTPLGNLFKLPNEGLAGAVALEWDKQPDILQMHNMHLTSLSNTSIDNPCKLTKENLVESALDYLETDTLCYRGSEPVELAELQIKHWNPVCSWFQKKFDVDIPICTDVMNIPIPESSLDVMRNHLMSFSMWSLTGINYAVENLKSLILALAITHRELTVEKAVECSRLEVIYQTKQWGSVEWCHDIENEQTRARVAAAALFVILNEETTGLKKKILNNRITQVPSGMQSRI